MNTPKNLEESLLAWTQVFAGFLLMFSSWGLVNTFGVFEAYYSQLPSFATTFAISWIGSLQSFLLLLLGAFSGRVVDAGYTRPMTIIGSALIVLGLVTMSLSGGNQSDASGNAVLVYWQIMLSQSVCFGAGSGLVFIPSVSITASYFQKRRSFAVGIVTTGAAFGGILYPIIFEALLSRLGYRWAARVVALVALVTLTAACLLIRPRSDLSKKNKAPLFDLSAFKEPPYLTLVAGMFASFVGVYVVYYYIESRATAANLDLRGLKPYYLVSFLNVGGVFGRVIPNYLADKTNPIMVQSIFVLCGGILLFVWPFVLNLPGLVVFCLVYGFFSGAFISLPPSSVASITPDMSRYGSRLGMAITCNAFGLLAGPPIAGVIIGDGSGYVNAALFAGLIVVAGAGSLCASRISSQRLSKKDELSEDASNT